MVAALYLEPSLKPSEMRAFSFFRAIGQIIFQLLFLRESSRALKTDSSTNFLAPPLESRVNCWLLRKSSRGEGLSSHHLPKLRFNLTPSRPVPSFFVLTIFAVEECPGSGAEEWSVGLGIRELV